MNKTDKTTENFNKTYKPFLEKLERERQRQKEFVIYYGADGEIKSVSPFSKSDLEKDYSSIGVLYEEIEDIVLGKKSVGKYYIEDGQLMKKEDIMEKSKYLLTSDADAFTKPVVKNDKAIVMFQLFKSKVKVSIIDEYLSKYQRLLKYNLVSEDNLNISGSKFLTFFIADRTDPNMLVDSFDVSVKDLVLNGKVEVKGKFDWKEMSVYCKHHVELGIQERKK